MSILMRCIPPVLVGALVSMLLFGCADRPSKESRQPGRPPGRPISTVGDSILAAIRRGDTGARHQVGPPDSVPARPTADRSRLIGALGPASADTAEVAIFVRSREAQVRFCYQEHGLRLQPSLAGDVEVAFRVNAGAAVDSAWIARRSGKWSGPGAAAAEACFVQRLRTWRVPSRWPSGQYGGQWQLRPYRRVSERSGT